MKAKITPYLVFRGEAEEAMNYYLDAFGSGEIVSMNRYGEARNNVEWSIAEEDCDKLIHGEFIVGGQTLYCADSTEAGQLEEEQRVHLTIACSGEEEINRLYERLSAGGSILMPLQMTFWQSKFAVVVDRFGIVWQLDLPQHSSS
ncbi:VOC family protein [Paenibacillus melissococcoides]|uniref:VOC family protein n=1 Tax=Paenibacillus melissococcoides TaxID=2912268 RepID=A0ABN8U644_9BACL|nr:MULTISPECIES: VOC family protein [Paenibacillus]MEB9897816.1 VOC family protein [Bacillus cereus]CAH8246487.1 VOC family protein [Paenibacillus melissococcoides]CAH8714893.1 VOC family protein [Paenibacillus melissococcoides]CAH8715847.1 VOC family protein [Paenibacillus melissococcoides]GIO81327.1 VOC family protein [Paenibacillus dendritiformis]